MRYDTEPSHAAAMQTDMIRELLEQLTLDVGQPSVQEGVFAQLCSDASQAQRAS